LILELFCNPVGLRKRQGTTPSPYFQFLFNMPIPKKLCYISSSPNNLLMAAM
jgi:hypothetical protein